MKGTNIKTMFVLPVLAVVAFGLYGLMAAPQSSAKPATAAIHQMTDAHDRVNSAQVRQTQSINSYGLTDAHDRVMAVYYPTDAADRALAARQYKLAARNELISDLSDRHTPDELRAIFSR